MSAPPTHGLDPEALVLAMDIGTSSLRTGLFDARARCIGWTRAQAGYALRLSNEGMAELDAAQLKEAAHDCLRQTLRSVRSRRLLRSRPIAAVGVSCFWHSLLGVDRGGRPITPIYTWADSRCRDDAAALRRGLSEVDIHQRTGCMLRSSYWPAKLRWLRKTQLRQFRRVALWMSPGEWWTSPEKVDSDLVHFFGV